MLMILIISLWTNSVGTPVDGERIRKAVEDHIYTKSGAARQDLVIEIRGRLPKLVVSSGDYVVRVAMKAAPQIKGHVSVPIEVVCQGRVEQMASISVLIRRFGSVLMTARQLPKHHDVAIEDVVAEQVETTTLPEDIVRELSEIEGKRTVRIVSGNCILTSSMLESRPVIRHDDHVALAVRSKKAIVTVQGVAKQDGRIGDVITVQRIGSYERYRGKVIGAHAVEICLEEPAPLLHANQRLAE